MNFKQRTGKSIPEAFKEFHNKNPKIYHHFKEYFFYLHNRKGWRKVGGKLIMERIRFEVLIMTKGSDFKIDNNFTAYYIRLFIQDYPQYEKCFELRTIKFDI